MKHLNVKAGCCGFRSSRTEYTKVFPVVEVQQTFYQPPKVETLRRWRAEAPPGFEFTLKAWMLITHEARSPTYRRLKRKLSDEEREGCGAFRQSAIVKEAWAATLASAEALGAQRVLFQCPASFTPTQPNIKNLRRFIKSIERTGLRLMWEPRGAWPDQLVSQLCDELDLIHVVDPFSARSLTPSSSYFRLHGRGGWGYKYETGELEELISMLPRTGETSYVLFNNVRMREDALNFLELARAASLDEQENV